MKKIRVLIVDDSFFMRKVMSDLLQLDPDIDIVGEAADGDAALTKIHSLHPDVVTLDIEMPNLNGVDTLRKIVDLPQRPAVLMVSGYAQEGGATTLQCLALGAVDFVMKPSGSFSLDMDKIQGELIAKVKAAADTHAVPPAASAAAQVHDEPQTRQYAHSGGVVVIGASTGGPAALETILPELPANFPYPVVVAQHLPKEFTASFVERLRKTCQLAIFQAKDGLALAHGAVYIAGGGTTTTIASRDDEPTLVVEPNSIDIETPSISKLMTSAADIYHEKTIGIVLTGMGSDGSLGAAAIKQAGGLMIVQDEATSAVYGMGRVVADAGQADRILPLGEIIRNLNDWLA